MTEIVFFLNAFHLFNRTVCGGMIGAATTPLRAPTAIVIITPHYLGCFGCESVLPFCLTQRSEVLSSAQGWLRRFLMHTPAAWAPEPYREIHGGVWHSGILIFPRPMLP
jgi:hypothetical protein